MSSKSNLAPHQYKLSRRQQLKQQHTTGQTTRQYTAARALQHNSDTNSTRPSNKQKYHEIDKGQFNSIKSKLNNLLTRQQQRTQKHQHNQRLQTVEQQRNKQYNEDKDVNSIEYTNNVEAKDGDVVQRHWYYKELKKIVENSDILLEVGRHTYIHIHTHKNSHTCIPTLIYTPSYIHTYIHTCIITAQFLPLMLSIHKYICVVYVYVCMCTCLYCIRIDTHTYICIYTNNQSSIVWHIVCTPYIYIASCNICVYTYFVCVVYA